MSDNNDLTINKNGCFLYNAEKPLPNETLIATFESGIENFYENVEIYADANISQEELDFVQGSFEEAAQFMASLTGDHLQIPPLHKTIKVFYRTQVITYENSSNTKLRGGYNNIDAVVLEIPMFIGCDKGIAPFRTREGYDPSYFYYISQITAHELLHSYLFPHFQADPATIIEEGLATYSQFLFASNYGGTTLPFSVKTISCPDGSIGIELKENSKNMLHEMFPKVPAKVLAETDIYEGAELEIYSPDGSVHPVTINNIFLSSGSVTLTYGSKQMEIQSGSYTSTGDLLLGIGRVGSEFKLLAFGVEDEIGRISVNKQAKVPNGVAFNKIGVIWGENGFGSTNIFINQDFGASSIVNFKFNQADKSTHTGLEYLAAFLMMTQLEELYWKTNGGSDDFDPLSFYKGLGEVHKSFRTYLFNEPTIDDTGGKYYLCESNVYPELCDVLGLPLDECYGIFKDFGLDPDLCNKNDGINICVPGQEPYHETEEEPTVELDADAQPEKEADISNEEAFIPEMETEARAGGCGINARGGALFERAVKQFFSNAINTMIRNDLMPAYLPDGIPPLLQI